jgi:maltose O-acetyltransferase
MKHPSSSEKARMLAGEFYNTRDEELLTRSLYAKQLTRQLNTLDPAELKQKTEILSKLLGALGAHAWIEPPFYCDYGEHIYIGEHTFVNMNCIFLDAAEIRIGKNGLIAPAVQIYSAYHPLAARERIRQNWREEDGTAIYRTQAAPVTIGDNVWIGGNTVIMPGVTIGDNAVVGAGSVVTKDIPADVLAVGSPCRVVRGL